VGLSEIIAGCIGGLARLGFLTGLITLHAAVVRVMSVTWTGVDYPWYLQCGVANQYLLGPGIQPSAFGVLFLASLLAFVRQRPLVASTLSAAAAMVHPTYLLIAGLLTFGFLIVLWREGQRAVAGLVAGSSLLLVAPILVYYLRNLAPTSAEQFTEAQRLLAEFRLPHHSLIQRWLDGVALAQVAWMFLGLLALRGTRLFPVLVLPVLVCTALTLVQAASGSPTLALLFPWRISALLMPLATAVNLAWLFVLLAPLLDACRPWMRLTLGALCAVVLGGVVVGGVLVEVRGLGYRSSEEEAGLQDYVRSHQQPGEVYLLPIRPPKLGTTWPRSMSTTFTPPPRSSKNATLIPVDLQRFRLITGAPIYVDFKSIPYKDVEVLEWFRRLEQCKSWYEQKTWDEPTRTAMRQAGITHIVVTTDRAEEDMEKVYEDRFYRIYRLTSDLTQTGRRED
jgi:hypothetical protein